MKQIIIGVSALLLDKFPHPKTCILIRREKNPYVGLWSLPGGRLEFGETINQGLKRELLEELGIVAEIVDKNPVITEVITEQEHFIVISKLAISISKIQEHEDIVSQTFAIEDQRVLNLNEADCTPNLKSKIISLITQ